MTRMPGGVRGRLDRGVLRRWTNSMACARVAAPMPEPPFDAHTAAEPPLVGQTGAWPKWRGGFNTRGAPSSGTARKANRETTQPIHTPPSLDSPGGLSSESVPARSCEPLLCVALPRIAGTRSPQGRRNPWGGGIAQMSARLRPSPEPAASAKTVKPRRPTRGRLVEPRGSIGSTEFMRSPGSPHRMGPIILGPTSRRLRVDLGPIRDAASSRSRSRDPGCEADGSS